MIQFKLQNIIDIADKIILILIGVICVSFSINLSAQNAPKIWDESNSDLKISSPLISELEVNQPFYLRYTQNLASFDLTKSVDWKIKDSNGNIIYTRHLGSNLDKNEVVSIQDPGSYLVSLSLKIDSSLITTTRNIKIIPKDSLYYTGLRLNEINHTLSQIELFNDSNRDIDTSSLIISYNLTEKFILSSITTAPSKSYVVVKLNQAIKSTDKIDLVFEKNLKQSGQQIIDSFDGVTLASQKDLNKDIQFDTQDKTWKAASPTLGQVNKFELVEEAKNTESFKGNFQKSETVRTGGFDQSVLSILPFLMILIAYIATLTSDKKDFDAPFLDFACETNVESQNPSKTSKFAKIKVSLQSCVALVEVFTLSAILRLQTL